MGRRKRGDVSLDRGLSKLGVLSRSEARSAILAGRVTVGRRVVRDPGLAVVPERTAIAIDGRAVEPDRAPLTVMLHKPRGVVTTAPDPQGRRTVFDCLAGLDRRVVAVGRLDWASSGLLLLTNRSQLAAWIESPRHAVPRTYVVVARGFVEEPAMLVAMAGVEDDGEVLRAEAVELLKRSRRESTLRVELRQGKNREIRRLLAALGHEVVRLKRIGLGGLALGDLPAGAWREVSAAELGRAFPGAPIP
jgi:23S rRNA pseudouridine2605 synthase